MVLLHTIGLSEIASEVSAAALNLSEKESVAHEALDALKAARSRLAMAQTALGARMDMMRAKPAEEAPAEEAPARTAADLRVVGSGTVERSLSRSLG